MTFPTLRDLRAASLTAAALSLTVPARAESPSPPPESPYTLRPSVMAGLLQWVAFGGANVAAQLKVGRVVFEYSHGQALDLAYLSTATLKPQEREEGVGVRMPWTTGGGAGLQLTPSLHALVELKAHRFEITAKDRNQIARYTSFTAGVGVFYDVYLAGGFFIQPVVRWWPTVGSTYRASDSTFRRGDGSSYTLPRHEDAFIVNVNVGYTFSGI